MEGSFIEENAKMTRCDCDRVLRSYRELNDMLKSSRSWGRHIGEDGLLDEAAIHSQMYAIRSVILALDDPKMRMFLYHYYIKGHTLETCGKLLGISIRSVYRLKNASLEKIAFDIKKIEGKYISFF
ncbi:MAG: sigma-70 family RNA polymerase sigma factor [Clostridia bacterium]|nr:sigma-70 family RNA polymerase sigma factor [Clostridia bacterium]